MTSPTSRTPTGARIAGAAIMTIAALVAVLLGVTEGGSAAGTAGLGGVGSGDAGATGGDRPATAVPGIPGGASGSRTRPDPDEVAAFQQLRKDFPFPAGARRARAGVGFSGASPAVGNYAVARTVRARIDSVERFYARELAGRGIGWDPDSYEFSDGFVYQWYGELDVTSVSDAAYGTLTLDTERYDDGVVTITVVLSL